MEKRCKAAAPGGWSALPGDVLARVLARLAGDVPSLCAAACVAPAWRDAAAEPQLWVSLKLGPNATAATRLTDARLKALVARSRGLLESLDVSGAGQLTDKGLVRSLKQPHALTAFSAPDSCRVLTRMTARGVARALASQRGRMRKLSVQGLNCGPSVPGRDYLSEGEGDRDAWHAACVDVIAALRALMAPDGVLDGNRLCYGNGFHELCPVLCGCADVCANCDEALSS